MATLYLHIGTPKTGTTAIQNFLPLNKSLLKEQGFCYPDFGYRYYGVNRYRNGHFLVHRRKNCDPGDESKIRKAEDNRFFEGLDRIRELSVNFQNIILSDENIWNGYVNRENFWHMLSDALSEREIDLKVIVYLRRQDLVAESYYSQRVKVKIKDSFKDYLESEDITYFNFDYYAQLKEIAQAIGKENIIVRVYEKQQYEGKGNTLISDFMKALGLELDERFVSPDEVVNTSLHGKFLELKRILNEYDCFRTRNNWAVRYLKIAQEEDENSNGISASKFFTYEQRINFLNKYKEGNKAVAREFLNNEDGILFRDEIIKNYAVVGKYSSEELVLVCGRVLEIQNKEMRNRIENMKKEINDLKRQIESETQPLYKKAAIKMYHTLFKNK